MVEAATSYSGNGLRDWLVQRVTAVILALYVIYLGCYVLLHHPLTFVAWQHLFGHTSMKIATLFAFGSLALHAWIGMWTIFTDYVKPFKIRLPLQVLTILTLLGYFSYGVIILWGL
jgi:succinate dehydrogenase / fumarate reductase, membrane anchor subunit